MLFFPMFVHILCLETAMSISCILLEITCTSTFKVLVLKGAIK